MKRFARLPLLVALLAWNSVPLHAQDVAEVAHPSAPEPGDPEGTRKRLNEEQARAAREQVEGNLERQRAREATIATAAARQDRDAAAYAEALRRHEGEVGAYEAARAKWESANPACKRNDPVKCPR